MIVLCFIIVAENISPFCPENKQLDCFPKHSLISDLRLIHDIALMPMNRICEYKEW